MVCPSCKLEKVVDLVSKTKNNLGKMFVKCTTNQSGVPNSCSFFLLIDKYKQYLVDIGLVHEDTTCIEDAILELFAVTSKLYSAMKGELEGLPISIICMKCQIGSLFGEMLVMKSFGADVDVKMSKLIKLAELQIVVNEVVAMLVFLLVIVILVK